MRSIRPIPRSALPDTMTVRVPLPDGTYEEPVLICNVRFERTQRVSDDNHRSSDAGGGTVFVDAVNSIGAFEVVGTPPVGVCLLVDDMVDSKWTLTIAAAMLLKAGAASVVPFALADSSGGE